MKEPEIQTGIIRHVTIELPAAVADALFHKYGAKVTRRVMVNEKTLRISFSVPAENLKGLLNTPGFTSKLISIKNQPPPPPPDTNILTSKQTVCFLYALESGYYDFPRRITLTELAHKFGVSKSTLSQALMRLESVGMHHLGKVIQNAPPVQTERF
jgi:predicted DNA binding protein